MPTRRARRVTAQLISIHFSRPTTGATTQKQAARLYETRDEPEQAARLYEMNRSRRLGSSVIDQGHASSSTRFMPGSPCGDASEGRRDAGVTRCYAEGWADSESVYVLGFASEP